jgi:hypothetical protein
MPNTTMMMPPPNAANATTQSVTPRPRRQYFTALHVRHEALTLTSLKADSLNDLRYSGMHTARGHT